MSANLTSWQTVSVSGASIPNALIDNDNYKYFAQVALTGAAASDLALGRVLIKYEYGQPGP